MQVVLITVYNGNTGVVRLLCQEYGVDADCSTSETLEEPPLKGITPLYWAAVKGHVELVKLLIYSTEKGVNARCANDGAIPLYIAAQNGHTEVVKMLMDHKADVNASRRTGATPLWIAAQDGHTEVVKLLLDHKADVNARRCTDNATPLYVAVQNGHTELVKLLLDHKADLNESMDTGSTPLRRRDILK